MDVVGVDGIFFIYKKGNFLSTPGHRQGVEGGELGRTDMEVVWRRSRGKYYIKTCNL